MSTLPIARLRHCPLQFYRSLQHSLLSNGTQTRLFQSSAIHLAKAADPNKPIVLVQPDQFRPPSHPARLVRRRKRMYYGRDLTEEDKEELNSKQYPYAFPPKQSFMHWFLTNRGIHVWISLVRGALIRA
jgi:hypothetical protein